MNQMNTLSELIDQFQIFHCVECGKCTGACPLAQVDRDFSPRLVAKYVIEEGLESLIEKCKTKIKLLNNLDTLEKTDKYYFYQGVILSRAVALPSPALHRASGAPISDPNANSLGRLWVTGKDDVKVGLSPGCNVPMLHDRYFIIPDFAAVSRVATLMAQVGASSCSNVEDRMLVFNIRGGMGH